VILRGARNGRSARSLIDPPLEMHNIFSRNLIFRCKSFNFLSIEKICELNDVDRESVEVPGYVQVGQTWVSSVDGLVPKDYFTLKSKVSVGLICKYSYMHIT